MENREASGSSSKPIEKKKTGGKKKIPIELISNKEARQVCFSKRRQGLFKKAKELSVLCGANVKVLTFSPVGKPYPFGSPSEQSDNAATLPNSADLCRQASELRAKIDASQRKNDSLKARRARITSSTWCADLATADLPQLEAILKDLQQVRFLPPPQWNISTNMPAPVVDPASSGVLPVPW